MAIFDQLQVWLDPVTRSGPEAMAVDEWLLQTTEMPVLRVYRWAGDWGSVGYFGKLVEAEAAFPGISWVRRWTGGGTVDHRTDWTYSVVAPLGSGIAQLRGAESYRILHAALAEALQAEGVDAHLSSGADQTGATLCFENPVGHDLIDSHKRKLAGAGQRRSRNGLLHQGSVAAGCNEITSVKRSERLAAVLAARPIGGEMNPPDEWIERAIELRYGNDLWTKRR
jgi:lipoate-protein ligase A